MLRAGVCASILIGLFVATAFWGCGGRSAAKPDPAEVKAYTQRGYVPDQRYETVETRDTWALGAGPVDISVLVPSTPGRYPLVLYMPGLGESAQAGALWRRAWARARAGEFYDLAKEAFSAPALAARVQILAETLAEVSRRQKDGRTPALANVDLTRIAIAGFDLGAQTAMVAAGEHVDGVAAPKLPEGVKCVIALSPYADFSGMGMKSNFQPIRLPVLSVTSSLDTDAYGLVTSPAVRRAPFQDMPSGRKYLLLLSIASHSVLAGTAPSAEGNGKGGAQRSEASAEDASMVNDESANPDEERPGRKRRRPDFSAAGRDRTAQHAKEEAQVQAVTTAYLDAIVEDDPVASEWLARNAKRWLGESGELTWK
jgi:hypothetical protein